MRHGEGYPIPNYLVEKVVDSLGLDSYVVELRDRTQRIRHFSGVSPEEVLRLRSQGRGSLSFRSANHTFEDSSRVEIDPFHVNVSYHGSEPKWVGKLIDLDELRSYLRINGERVSSERFGGSDQNQAFEDTGYVDMGNLPGKD